MEESLQQQVGIGFSEKDVDDVRRLISDTSIYLLTATLVASLLHLLFEILAFQSGTHVYPLSTYGNLNAYYIYVYAFIYLRMYMYGSMYMYTYMYIDVYTYTHVHIYTYQY
jgi:hypothetical protein